MTSVGYVVKNMRARNLYLRKSNANKLYKVTKLAAAVTAANTMALTARFGIRSALLDLLCPEHYMQIGPAIGFTYLIVNSILSGHWRANE